MRPPTKNMIEHLHFAYKTLSCQTPKRVCTADDFKGTLAGLYRRGLIDTKMQVVDGKEIIGIYITQKGIDYLNECNYAEC